MTTKNTPATQTGIVVSTPITAGGIQFNHAEGIVVSTAITADGLRLNHAEGIVGSTPVSAGVVVKTGILAGPRKIFIGGLSG